MKWSFLTGLNHTIYCYGVGLIFFFSCRTGGQPLHHKEYGKDCWWLYYQYALWLSCAILVNRAWCWSVHTAYFVKQWKTPLFQILQSPSLTLLLEVCFLLWSFKNALVPRELRNWRGFISVLVCYCTRSYLSSHWDINRKDINLQAYDTAVIRNVKISTQRKGNLKMQLSLHQICIW